MVSKETKISAKTLQQMDNHCKVSTFVTYTTKYECSCELLTSSDVDLCAVWNVSSVSSVTECC